jgi:hypothetical protein
MAATPALITALLAAAFSTVTSAQQIYGWTDSNGVVTYSNLPPPKGVKVTDIIPDTPLSPQAVQDAARRSEISALNDRIRLLEFEQARSKREVVDYPPEPAQLLSAGCSPDANNDCNSQWGPYYSVGFLYGSGVRRDHGGHAVGHSGGHPAQPPIHLSPPPISQGVPIAASPNRSSLQQR